MYILYCDSLVAKKKKITSQWCGLVEDQHSELPAVPACLTLKWQYHKTNTELCAVAQPLQVCFTI